MALVKRGSVWYVVIRDHRGKQRWVKAGSSKYVARELENALFLRKQLEAENLLAEPEIRSVPFRDFAEEYLEWCRVKNSASTVNRKVYHLRIFGDHFGDVKLDQITPRDIERFVLARSKKRLAGGKLSNRTLNMDLLALHHMMERAVARGFAKANPVKRVDRLPTQKKLPRFLTEAEVEVLLQYAQKELLLWLATALYTGMRKGELFRLTWGDVDLERKEIRVLRTKNNRYRVIPITDLLLPVLQEHRHGTESGDLLFPSPRTGEAYGDRNRKTSYEAMLKKAARMARIEKRVTPHVLRHTFASHCIMSGIGIRTVQALMGHTTIGVTVDIYSHLVPEHVSREMEKLRMGSEQVRARLGSEPGKVIPFRPR